MLEKEGRTPPKPEELAFGFGRRFVNCSTTADLVSSDSDFRTCRICPGRYFAVNTMFITIVHILGTFTIARPVDESGKEVVPEGEYYDELTRYVYLFSMFSDASSH